jgi:hypothetical protein
MNNTLSSQIADNNGNEKKLLLDLFKEIISLLPSSLILPKRLINWHLLRLALSYYRYDREQVRIIVNTWRDLGLIEMRKFKGVALTDKGLGVINSKNEGLR